MTTTDKTYITLSIKKHVHLDLEKALLLEELSKISDSDTSTLVKFMGRINSITSGAFKEADEFLNQGISDPQVLAQFTPSSTAVLQQIKNGDNTANINVNVAIGGTDPTGTNGLFTLNTTNKNSIIEAINEVYNSVNSAFTTAGGGLTASGTTVSINFTGVSTDGSTTPTSLAQVIGSIDIGGGTLTDAIKTLQTSNAAKLDTAGDGIAVSDTTIAVKLTTTTNKGGLEFDATDQGLEIKLATNSGLSTTSGSLAIGAGTGITVNANDVALTPIKLEI